MDKITRTSHLLYRLGRAVGSFRVQEMELQFTANTIAQRKPTLVDLSELEYIASLGLRMLITAAKALLRHGLKLVLLGPQLHVEEVFRSTGFDQLMPVESTEEQALTHFQS